MIKRILVGLAGTTYTSAAIATASRLAQAHHAELAAVTLLDPDRIEPPRDVAAQSSRTENDTPRPMPSSERVAESIREFEATCQRAQLRGRVFQETGDAFGRLMDLARYHDVMVLGLKSVFEYDFASGRPETLLVKLVGAGVRPIISVSKEFREVSRVLIAYNGSMESAKAMKRFVQMRLWPDAELRIVTFHPSEETAYQLLLAAEEYCQAHGFRVSHQSNPGDPRVLLLAAASLWQADLIVLGNSARSALVRKLLGDTLLSTLRETHLPLFLAQ